MKKTNSHLRESPVNREELNQQEREVKARENPLIEKWDSQVNLPWPQEAAKEIHLPLHWSPRCDRKASLGM